MTESTPVHKRKGSFLGTLKAVLWGFLGVRRRSDYERDITQLNPLHLIAMGVFMAIVFVMGLIFLVNWIAA